MLMRKAGPLRTEYEKLAPTMIYYPHYLSPTDMRPAGVVGPEPSGFDKLTKKAKQWRHQQLIKKWVHDYEPDLIYSNTSVNGDILKNLGSPASVLVHVRELWTTIDLYNDTQRTAFANPNYRYFAVSHFVKEYLHDKHNIEPERISIVPGSVEPESFDARAAEKSDDQIRAELNIPRDSFIVGGIGSIDSRKGVDIFVDAAQQTIMANPERDIRFVWVGAGGMRGELEKNIAKTGLETRIIFTGERKNPYPYLKTFNLGLMTSRDDPFPRSVLEMAAFGTPIICFKGVGGAPEFVSDDAGIVLENFDPAEMANAITSILDNDDLAAKFSATGSQKAREKYNTNTVGANATALLDELLARYQGR